MTSSLRSIAPVWTAVALACIAIPLGYPGINQYTWLPLVLAAAILVTFVIQVPSHSTEGFLSRLLAGIGGSVAIVAIATAVLAVVRG